MTDTAAFVRNGRLDILSANPLGYALYSPVFDPAPAIRGGPQPRQVHLPRDQLPAVLPRLGQHRPRRRRQPARRGRTRPARPGPDQPGRRAVPAQPALPGAVGCARRRVLPQRHPAVPPSPGPRPRPRVRRPGDPGRPGADHHRLQRRTGFGRPPGTWHPRQLGRYPTTSGTAQYGRAPGRAHTWVAPNTVARIRCRRGQQRCRGLRLSPAGGDGRADDLGGIQAD